MVTTAIIPAISAAIELAGMVMKKNNEVSNANRYIDRSKVINNLFDPDTRDDAYRLLYVDMQSLCAKKGITPNCYYEGAPCINIPLGTLVNLMDAAA